MGVARITRSRPRPPDGQIARKAGTREAKRVVLRLWSSERDRFLWLCFAIDSEAEGERKMGGMGVGLRHGEGEWGAARAPHGEEGRPAASYGNWRMQPLIHSRSRAHKRCNIPARRLPTHIKLKVTNSHSNCARIASDRWSHRTTITNSNSKAMRMHVNNEAGCRAIFWRSSSHTLDKEQECLWMR